MNFRGGRRFGGRNMGPHPARWDWSRGRGRGNFCSFQKTDGGNFPPNFNPGDVLAWLDQQHPFVIQRVLFHAQWLLQQHGVPPLSEEEQNEDGGENEEPPSGSWYSPAPNFQESQEEENGSYSKRGKIRPGFGYQPGPSQQQWTPGGWVVKDNSHKITTKMKPLPEQEIIPPFSSTYPEAADDKSKLKMLTNNFNMMDQELTKICRTFKIASLNKDDLTIYPEDQQERLKTAVNCVAAAKKTLEEFKEYLKTDKYQKWNDEQKAAYEEKIKNMIGETPQGIPYKKPKLSDDSQSEGQ